MTDQTEYESVNTHQLKEGDVVRVCGCTFRLKNRQEWPAPDDNERRGVCISFGTDPLTYSDAGGFPEWWFKDWIVQGNKLATWARQIG